MNKKIIYIALACLTAGPQLLKAQNVGIGTTTPAAALDVKGHGRSGILGTTDSVAGPAFTYAQYNNAPAGIRGEYRATGLNHGSGVVGTALSSTAGYGNGVTGKGGFTGIYGMGSNGGLTGVYAAADSATWGLYVDGNSSFGGNTITSGNASIGGTIKIQGGSPGAGKVLTSDASGLASWQASAEKVGFSALLLAGFPVPANANITTLPFVSNGVSGTGTYASYQTFDDGSNFNENFNSFIAPSAGLYHFDITVWLNAAVAAGNGTISLYLERSVGGVFFVSSLNVRSAESIPRYISGSLTMKMNAGESIAASFSHSLGQTITVNLNNTLFSGYKIY